MKINLIIIKFLLWAISLFYAYHWTVHHVPSLSGWPLVFCVLGLAGIIEATMRLAIATLLLAIAGAMSMIGS